jgi:hypothetical protein
LESVLVLGWKIWAIDGECCREGGGQARG